MPPASNFDSDPDLTNNLFTEPPNYYPPSKPATQTTYTLLSGRTLHLRLVGHNPLWGHYLWNGAQIVSTYIQNNIPRLVHGKYILELGAGAGLPGLVAAILGAGKVVVTDYPDAELVENLRYNIETCDLLGQRGGEGEGKGNIVAEGYLWGADTVVLHSHLSRGENGFDTLILADLLFNHHCHDALVSTILRALARTVEARALVFFTPYRPWLLDKDMAFFDLCRERGLEVEEVVRERMVEVMFKEDRGDEELRRTVFGYEVRWGEMGE